jgi:hypothetical protein
MGAFAGRFAFKLVFPILAFLFIGIPIETYVRGLDGVFSTQSDFYGLVTQHLFFEAAACFYCITALFEAVLILTRPHLRGRAGLPITGVLCGSLLLGVISTAAYIYIRVASASDAIDSAGATSFLVGLIVATTVVFAGVHVADYLSSSEVAPRPRNGRTQRARS